MKPKRDLRTPILEWLADNPDQSRTDIGKAIKANSDRFSAVLRELHEEGEIHISGWRIPKAQGLRSALYSHGWGKDVEQPPLQDRQAIYRARHKADISRRRYGLKSKSGKSKK